MRVKGSFITFFNETTTHKKVNQRDFVRNDYEYFANHPIIRIWLLQ